MVTTQPATARGATHARVLQVRVCRRLAADKAGTRRCRAAFKKCKHPAGEMNRDAYRPSWTSVLEAAVREPGLLHTAYQAFHRYSLGNQVLAMLQCTERDLPLGPLNTFIGWKALGRHVKKGEKALTLCMPVTAKRSRNGRDLPIQTEEGTLDSPSEGEAAATYTRFVYRPNWFVLAQTDGEPYQLAPLLGWDKNRALTALGVTEIPFLASDGNIQGYAVERSIAINPVAAVPHKTLFHELGHIELGHTCTDAALETKPERYLREAEAESVALLMLETLGLDGSIYSRGYLQHWLQGDKIPNSSAQRIFGAAERILKAGTMQLDDQ